MRKNRLLSFCFTFHYFIRSWPALLCVIRIWRRPLTTVLRQWSCLMMEYTASLLDLARRCSFPIQLQRLLLISWELTIQDFRCSGHGLALFSLPCSCISTFQVIRIWPLDWAKCSDLPIRKTSTILIYPNRQQSSGEGGIFP